MRSIITISISSVVWILGLYLFRKLKKRESVDKPYFFIIATSMFLCYLFLSCFPVTIYSKTPIVITALNDADVNAEGNEVFIKEIVVDGEIYHSPRVKSGCWVYRNGRIGWRTYSTPIDITSSIEILIPVGSNREIIFESNIWRGKAKIQTENEVFELNFYAPTENDSSYIVNLESSAKNDLLLNFLIQLLSSFLLLSLLVIAGVIIYIKLEKIKILIANNFTHFVCGSIAIFAFLFMMHYSSLKSLWADDIAQIHFTNSNLTISEMINRLLAYDVQPPFQSIITAIWLRIAPYGTAWLKLPSEIAVALGIFICGQIGLKTNGRLTAIVYSALAACSSSLIIDAGYSFRPYGFFFLFSSLVLYSFIDRASNYENFDIRSTLRYTCVLTLMIYTHYFGLLICIALFFAESYLVAKNRKKSISFIIAYIATALLFSPWAILAMVKSINRFSTFWPDIPTLKSVIGSLTYLLSSNDTLILILIVSITLLAFQIYNKKRIKEKFDKSINVQLISIWCIIFVIGVTFIYSSVINRSRSVFVLRYFIGLFPYIFLLLAHGISELCNLVTESKTTFNKNAIQLVIVICFLVTVFQKTYPAVVHVQNEKYQTWEETADWLYYQPDIFYESTLVINTCGWSDGWDYYLTHSGKRNKVKRLDASSISQDDLIGINKIYLFNVHNPLGKDAQKLITSEFHQTDFIEEVSIVVYERIQ